MAIIELKKNTLAFQFAEVHTNATLRVDFQRTLRIPDDNREYPLPPGLGAFPIEHVQHHAVRLPAAWSEHGGVLLPMYQAEALWISFGGCGAQAYPFAVKIAAGKINAVTGEPWSDGLGADPQDYVVVPEQPWLDGFCVRRGLIRQFVAMPLGQGYTAEEQISATAEHGGIQIVAYPMKRERYEALPKWQSAVMRSALMPPSPSAASSMGLAPGGLMRQEIYDDPHGLDAWDISAPSRCFVHILNSTQWAAATGKPAPGTPPSAANYTAAGLPWFEYYDDKLGVRKGAKKLAELDSVGAKAVKLGEKPLADNGAVNPSIVLPLGPASNKVNDGKW